MLFLRSLRGASPPWSPYQGAALDPLGALSGPQTPRLKGGTFKFFSGTSCSQKHWNPWLCLGCVPHFLSLFYLPLWISTNLIHNYKHHKKRKLLYIGMILVMCFPKILDFGLRGHLLHDHFSSCQRRKSWKRDIATIESLCRLTQMLKFYKLQ